MILRFTISDMLFSKLIRYYISPIRFIITISGANICF